MQHDRIRFPASLGMIARSVVACVGLSLASMTYAAEPMVVQVEEGELQPTRVDIDGHRMVVGVHDAEVDGTWRQGVAYVFEWDGSEWQQTARLLAPDGDTYDHFGGSLDIGGDTVAIGSRFKTVSGLEGSGAVYVFNLVDGEWQFTQRVTAEDLRAEWHFGWSVSVDNDVMMVGSVFPADGETRFSPEGAVYLFEYDPPRSAWQQVARFEERPEHDGYGLGYSVGVSGDAAAAGVGERLVYVFERNTGSWHFAHEVTVQSSEAQGSGVKRIDFEGDVLAGVNDWFNESGQRTELRILERDNGTWVETGHVPVAEDNVNYSAAYASGVVATQNYREGNRIFLHERGADGEWQRVATIEDPQPAFGQGVFEPAVAEIMDMAERFIVLRGEQSVLVYDLNDVIPGRDADRGDDDNGDDSDDSGNDDSDNDHPGGDDGQGVGGGDGSSGDDQGGGDNTSGDDSNDDNTGGDTGSHDSGGDDTGNDDSGDAESNDDETVGSEDPPARSDTGGGAAGWLLGLMLASIPKFRKSRVRSRLTSFFTKKPHTEEHLNIQSRASL